MANFVNFDEVKELSFINETGSYVVKVVNVERRDSNAGKTMDVYTLETQDKLSINHYLSLSEKARFKYKEFVRAVNNIEGSVGVIDLDNFPKTTIGKKVRIEVVSETITKLDIGTNEEKEVKSTKITKVLPL